MAYNSNKGKQHSGDVLYESDPTDTQIDFENDFVAIKTNGLQRFIVSGSFITSSIPLSCSVEISASAFYGDGSNLTGIGGGTMSTFIVSGNAGTEQTISDGNTLFISGGTGITSVGAATDQINISLDNTDVTPGSYTYTQLTVDEQGRITAASNGYVGIATLTNVDTVGRLITSVGSVAPKQANAEANLTFVGDTLNVVGDITSSLGVSGSTFRTATTVIDSTHVSSSLNISGAAFYGDGSNLTGLPSGVVTAYNNYGSNRVITAGAAAGEIDAETSLTFDGNKLSAVGHISASLGVSGSSLNTEQTVINTSHVSSSLNISGAAFYGDGSNLTGIGGGGAISTYNTPGDNRVITSVDSNTVQGEQFLTFDGSALSAPAITSSVGVHVSGATSRLSIGDVGDATNNGGMLFIRPTDTSNRALCLMQSKESEGNRVVFAVTGSGKVLVGGGHLDGVFNVSGSDAERLISARADTAGTVFTLSSTGDGAFAGQLSASLGVTGSSLETVTTVINSIHLSSSLNVSGAAFYGDGSNLTGLPSAAIATLNTPGINRVITSDGGSAATARTGLTFNGTTLNIVGNLTASIGVSGSSLRTAKTVLDSQHVSSSLNISGAAFYANGVLLTGGGAGAISNYNTPGDNRVITSVDSNTVQGEELLTFDGTALSAPVISSSVGVHITGSTPHLQVGTPSSAPSLIMFNVTPKDTDNKVLMLAQSREASGNRTIFAVTGSGKVLVGGSHLDGVLNVSGSDTERLISVKSNTKNPVFKLEADGELYNSGSVTLKATEPYLILSSSVDTGGKAQIGLNLSNNILIQNNTNNKHIVFKVKDSDVIKEGLRLDGAVPEVVVNQQSESLINFRVESDTKTHMLYVTGSGHVGIDNADPKTALDVHHDPTTLLNDTGGGEVVKFGGGTTVQGKTYYLHSNGNWDQVSIATATSGGLGMLAIALGTNPASDGMLIRGFFDAHSYLVGSFTPGATLYITASGGLTTTRPSTSGESLRVAGTCTTTANVVYFNPSPDYLIIN